MNTIDMELLKTMLQGSPRLPHISTFTYLVMTNGLKREFSSVRKRDVAGHIRNHEILYKGNANVGLITPPSL